MRKVYISNRERTPRHIIKVKKASCRTIYYDSIWVKYMFEYALKVFERIHKTVLTVATLWQVG